MKIDKNYMNHMLANSKPVVTYSPEELAAAKQAQGKMIMSYTLPEDMTMTDIQVPSSDPEVMMTLRIYKSKPAMPVVLEIHGGGWVGGNLEIDNSRCIAIAKESGCTVIGVDYRRASETVHFPTPLMDCLAAYKYIQSHSAELDVDGSKIALHGTSAGANLCAGLALYLRDKFHEYPALTVLNCGVFSMNSFADTSAYQAGPFNVPGGNEPGRSNATVVYLGELNGQQPSYYAFPQYCDYFEGMGPHMIICAEYDGLRDDSVKYANKLMAAAVPCELMVAPRVGHGFCTVQTELTDIVHKMIGYSLRREFGL